MNPDSLKAEVATRVAEGRAIVEHYWLKGKLTAAEARAFLGWEKAR